MPRLRSATFIVRPGEIIPLESRLNYGRWWLFFFLRYWGDSVYIHRGKNGRMGIKWPPLVVAIRGL